MNNIGTIIIQILVVLFALSVHESAHGWMAEKFGDPTARLQGRITLNPIAHIDPVGTIVFPLILAIIGAPVFGWAKPVMVNPNNLRNPKKDNIYISAAGPVSNIIVAIISIILFLIFKRVALTGAAPGNSHVIEAVSLILLYTILINIFLAIFNLIPIPPLDGSGIIEGVLKGDALVNYEKIKPYGFFILLAIIYLGIFDMIANPIIKIVMRLVYYG